MWATAAGIGLVAMLPIGVAAQTITISGTVLRAGEGTPVSGATVRLSPLQPVVTDQDGRFQLRGLPPGRATLVVQAIGYRLRLVDVTVRTDTTLQIMLERLPVQLDTVRSIAGSVTITGRVRDSATHRRVLQGEVTLYPGARTVGILTGGFRITGVPRDSVTLVVEGFQHLPAELTFVAAADTSIVVDLAIDSVALRMTAQQVARLAQRANAVPFAQQALTGADVRESGAVTVWDFIQRRLMLGRGAATVNRSGDRCVFYDDVQIAKGAEGDVLKGIPMETLERLEIYGSDGRMIRVYTTRYVASLARSRRLPRIVYMRIGLSPVCQ